MKRKKSDDMNRVLDAMRKGAVMVHMSINRGHTPLKMEYYLVPGGVIDRETAERIKEHPQVPASGDGIWPGHDQTWKIQGAAS